MGRGIQTDRQNRQTDRQKFDSALLNENSVVNLWKALPNNIKSANTTEKFKRLIKSHSFRVAYC
jgi:hypothetical protein